MYDLYRVFRALVVRILSFNSTYKFSIVLENLEWQVNDETCIHGTGFAKAI